MDRIFVDIREPSEYAASHVKGAINIPPSEILNGAKSLSGVGKNTELVLYCHTGERSLVAINILKSMGFTNLINGINKEHVETKYKVV